MYSSLTVNDIKNCRKQISSSLFNIRSFPYINDFDDMSQKIIVDALVYLYYKLGDEFVLNSLKFSTFVDSFLSNVKKNHTINFQSVIDSYIKNAPCKHSINIEEILPTTNIDNYPDANLATQLFLLRGNFEWDMFPMTYFSMLLQDKLSNVPCDASINCWEVCLLAMYKAKLISLDTLNKLYLDENLKPLYPDVIYDNIVNTFTTDKMLTLDNLSSLNEKSYVINFFKASHVMISVPFSQKQILKMLITENFDELPSRQKFYSLWNKWTSKKLGTVKKHEFSKYLEKINNDKPTCLHDINF